MRFSPLPLAPPPSDAAREWAKLSSAEREARAREYVSADTPETARAELGRFLARALPLEAFENLRALLELRQALSARDLRRASAAVSRLSFPDVSSQIEAGQVRQSLEAMQKGLRS